MDNNITLILAKLKDQINLLSLSVNIYALILSILSGVLSFKKTLRLWRTRHLRKVWGIKDKDYVILVCSELDNPIERQMVEPREFIYHFKYGDVDAYFEVVITLLRLYPNIKLKIMSAGEAEATRIDFAQHLILIGGPDYNSITEKILKKKITQFDYKSPYVDVQSEKYPDEIVLYHRELNKEFCYPGTSDKDYGYFERIINPNNPDSQIILIGGCHTVGVTGAVKAFSMAESERGEIPEIVLNNARLVAKRIKRTSSFAVLVSVERVAQSINIPVIKGTDITLK